MNKPGDIIRKHCLPTEPIDEAVRLIMETHANNFTMEDALDMITGAMDEVAEHPEDTKEWALIDKVTWSVRHAYLCGAGYATKIMFEMIEMAAADADKEGCAT